MNSKRSRIGRTPSLGALNPWEGFARFVDCAMRSLALLILVVLTALCGCVHGSGPRFRPGVGDAGQFILREATARGAKPLGTNALPAIRGWWRYSEDEYGVDVRLPRGRYAAVETFLRQAFGRPAFGPIETEEGIRYGLYELTPEGGSIRFSYDAQGTHVSVARALSREELQKEVLDPLVRALKGKRLKVIPLKTR